MQTVDFTALDRAGLNLHAVFDIAALPADVRSALAEHVGPNGPCRQLILLGHGGTTLWAALKASGIVSANPIDDFSRATVDQWFAANFPDNVCRILYPGGNPPSLQRLGQLAGWHHPSPFMVGINAYWGSWFAYRVVLLADTELAPTPALAGQSPCVSCSSQPCRPACPAGALPESGFVLQACLSYRRQPDSACRSACLARLACPVGAEHRYCAEQIRHSYSISLRDIERYC